MRTVGIKLNEPFTIREALEGASVFNLDWLIAERSAHLMIFVSALLIYIALLTFTRLSGLRSFSKLSSFDFAITVSIGSIIATTVVSKDPPVSYGVVALASLYGMQHVVAWLRQRFKFVETTVDNRPLLLMCRGEVLEQNLKKGQITCDDLRAKLRHANVSALAQVAAVVLETTGDITVIKDADELDDWLFEDVRGYESAFGAAA